MSPDVGRPSFGRIFMTLADLLSQRSTCRRARVGCVIVTQDNHQVLSIGYNGGPKGLDNDCASEEVGNCGCAHAELNSLVKLPFDDPRGKRMYTTTEPCRACSVLIVNAGVQEVVYLRDYRKHEGTELLQRAGIKIWKFQDDLLSPQ